MDTADKIVLMFGVVVLIVVLPTAGFNILSNIDYKIEKGAMMVNLSKQSTINEIRANISSYFGNKQSFTYKDVFEWENFYLKYKDNLTEIVKVRSTDPTVILKNGVGKCQEFSILFASGCISVGLPVRIVNVVKLYYCDLPHSFNEVKLDGEWVQADTSINATTFYLNNTSIYHSWYWWQDIGKTYKLFSFDASGQCYDVTYYYASCTKIL